MGLKSHSSQRNSVRVARIPSEVDCRPPIKDAIEVEDVFWKFIVLTVKKTKGFKGTITFTTGLPNHLR